MVRLMPATWSYCLEERRCLSKRRYGYSFVEALAMYSKIKLVFQPIPYRNKGFYQGISLGSNKEIVPWRKVDQISTFQQ